MNVKVLCIAVVSFVVLIAIALLISLLFAGAGLSFGEKIAVIPVKGEISSEKTSFSTELSSNELIERLKEAEDDPGIKAIFLDIDSPGGSVVATRQVAYKVRDIEKPVVAWIGDLGASGAYYVAAAADNVFADQDSITGSIGVISMIPDFQGLMEKIGVDMNIVKEGKHKDMLSSFTEFTEEDKALLQGILKPAFEKFKADVVEFRGKNLSVYQFNEVADGRILSGKQAKDAGLIDGLTTREEAIKKTAELAGIKGEPVLEDFGRKEISFTELFALGGKSFGLALKQSLLQKEISIK